jgi:hypothetical protein
MKNVILKPNYRYPTLTKFIEPDQKMMIHDVSNSINSSEEDESCSSDSESSAEDCVRSDGCYENSLAAENKTVTELDGTSKASESESFHLDTSNEISSKHASPSKNQTVSDIHTSPLQKSLFMQVQDGTVSSLTDIASKSTPTSAGFMICVIIHKSNFVCNRTGISNRYMQCI